MAIVLEETDDYVLCEEPQWDEGPYHLAYCRHCPYETPVSTIKSARLVVGIHVQSHLSGAAMSPEPSAGGTEYDAYPNHPLHGVRREILETARQVMDEAAAVKALDGEDAHPLADAVVMALLEAGYLRR